MFDAWVWKMAWRDSRGSRRRLFLFMSSMVLGVAALVAISSFGENLERAVNDQARTLLGADLSFEHGQPFEPEMEALIDSLGGLQSRRISFSSMAYFPRINKTRLATVRALEGDYPYYGAVETDPPEAAATYQENQDALVDGSLLEQFGAAVGDSVRIGRKTYRIAGRLLKTPRESAAMMLFSPRIYIPMENLDRALLSTGSRAEYEVYFKFDDGVDVEALLDGIRPRLREYRVGSDTVAEVEENWGEGLGNLYRFLNLVGFAALLLGGVGVASAVHVYVRQRIDSVAVLRCLGARSGRTFAVYLVQTGVMGVLAAGIGCLLGIGVQFALPGVLADFLPVDVTFRLSWRAVLTGILVGVFVALLFALLPLLAVRRISPLTTLRRSVEPSEGTDWARIAVIGLLIAGITAFAIAQAPTWLIGLGYAGGLAAVFGLLALVAQLIMRLTRRFFPSRWAYPWRQGLANLYRPNNQTSILMLALGLGTFLIMTLIIVQRTLLAQIDVAGGEGRANLILFDIQPGQLSGIRELIAEKNMPILEEVPIVTMRLTAVKGETVEAMRTDSTRNVTWAHRREYRSTYRSTLTDSETLIAGTFTGEVEEGDGAVPVSVEREIAEELNVTLGDTLVFDVQGLSVTTVVGSIREVEWQRIQTNFFVVFPEGVLNDAPQFHVILSRSDSEETSAALQAGIVSSYPNVSSIDLSLILNVFDSIYQRVSFVVRFMALFSILTGLIVLVGAIMVSRYQRMEESVLLKTLGASRRQVMKIMLIEYFFLGLFASLTGLLLAFACGWGLAYFVFEAPFVVAPGPLVAAILTVTGLTVMVGLLNSLGVYSRPPLDVLRMEV